MTAFWDWRSAPVTQRQPAQLLTEAPLEAVELYTENAMVLGQVAPDGQRLSDILNSNSHLPIKNAQSISMIGGVEGSEGQGWSSVPTDEILLAMPPEHVSPRQMRIHRRQHRVRINTGPYQMIGNAHVLPGVKLDPFVLRARMRFLALTQAHVLSTIDPAWERAAAVVLVNVRPLTDLTEVVTIS